MKYLAVLLSLLACSAQAQTLPCEIAGSGTPADSARAREGCAVARSRFEMLFGGPVPGVTIVLSDSNSYQAEIVNGRLRMLAPNSRTLRSAAIALGNWGTLSADRIDAQVEDRWRDIYPHELSHALLWARFFPNVAISESRYATPFPDWFDEAVAIWAESSELKEQRLSAARSDSGARDLAAILSADHPSRDAPDLIGVTGSGDLMLHTTTYGPCKGYCPESLRQPRRFYTFRLVGADGRVTVDTLPEGSRVVRAIQDGGLFFYPRAYAVLSFIYERGGRPAMVELAQRLQSGAGPIEAVLGLPGLPGDLSGIQAQWGAWLADTAAVVGRDPASASAKPSPRRSPAEP